MLSLRSRILVVISCVCFFSGSGFAQQSAGSVGWLAHYQMLHQPRNFTPINLKALGEITKRKAPEGEQVAYWTACGGNYNTQGCAACARHTDYLGVPQCVFCHSCGNGCPDDRRIPGGC